MTTLRARAQEIRDESLAVEALLKETADPEVVLGCYEDLSVLVNQLEATRQEVRRELNHMQTITDEVKAQEASMREDAARLLTGTINENARRQQTRQDNDTRRDVTIKAMTAAFHTRLMLQMPMPLSRNGKDTNNDLVRYTTALQYLGNLSKCLIGSTTTTAMIPMEANQFLNWARARIRELAQHLLSHTLPFPQVRGDELSLSQWTMFVEYVQGCVAAATQASNDVICLDVLVVLELSDTLLRLATTALAVEPTSKNESAFCDGLVKITPLATLPLVWEMVGDAITRRCRNFISTVEKENSQVAERVKAMVEGIGVQAA